MIFFTICANNYLSEALSLGDSLVKNDLDAINFKIFLIDRKIEQVNYNLFSFEIIEIDEKIVHDFHRITQEYKIVELSTSIKPTIFKYLISQNPKIESFTYVDPDLFFFNSVTHIKNEISKYSVLLTPHITTPLPINSDPFENTFLNYGLYNLGFISLVRNEISSRMLDWWESRTMKMGYDDVSNGLFVDQLWMNLAPLFFPQIKISNNIGLNVSYWNFFERKIIINKDIYFVNNESTPLIFYHFSSFDFENLSITKRGNNLNESDNNWKVFAAYYKEKLIENNYTFFKPIKPFYKIKFENYLNRFLPHKPINMATIKMLVLLKRFIPIYLLRKISNLHHKISIIEGYKSTL